MRAAFDRVVAAQNAHDAGAVSALLADSPDFLWVTRGEAIWGREAAMARFRTLWQGTWHLEPDSAAFRIVLERPGVAEVFVPVTFTIGAAGQPPATARFLMNQVWVDGKEWTLASLLPIPVPAPAAAPPSPAAR